MTDIMENLLSSMSTAFNSSPTPGDEASVIDLNEDKTLKWRQHLNNQYARKPSRKSAIGAGTTVVVSENAIKSDAAGSTDKTKVTTTTEATPKPSSADEESSSAPLPPPPQPLGASPSAAHSAPRTDNDIVIIAADTHKEEERDAVAAAVATTTAIAAKAHKSKKSRTTANESPARRSNRTRVTVSVSPVPQRRGRSRKVIDLDISSSDKKEEVQLESNPIETVDKGDEDKMMEIEESKTIKIDQEKMTKGKELKTKTTIDETDESRDSSKTAEKDPKIAIPNGNSNSLEEDDDSMANRKRKRRSVRLGTKVETPEPEILVAKIEEIDEKEAIPPVEEKTPKKRGRRSKNQMPSSPATSTSDAPSQSKKPQRISKEIVRERTPPKETKISEKQVPSSSQRPLRRIKPTAKILENEELRYEFESKNIARIVATTPEKPANEPAVDTSRPSRNRDLKDAPSESKNNTTPNKKKQPSNNLNVDNIYPSKRSRPCPEPQDFLNEIKAAGINLHKSPEDKKLNRKQHKKLIRQKEKMLERLGLRRNSKNGVTDSEATSTDNDEFVPTKKVNVGKPNVTLRIRCNKENSTEKTAVSRPEDRTKTLLPCSASAKDPCQPGISLVNKEMKLICFCQAKSKFYARKSTEVVYCKAIDHVEDHRVGCFNRVRNDDIIPLFRPSTRVPYLLLCDQHIIRFLSHNSCAGCGVFCTQGSFILCKYRHFFHPNCAQKLILNTPYDPTKRSAYPSPKLVLKCPHCGCDTSEKESLVTMKCQNTPVFLPSQKAPMKPAKMALSSSDGKLSIVRQQSQQCLDLIKYIPESVMNVVVREGADFVLNDFTTKDIFYAVNNDDLERVAEIIRSGFDIASEMKEFLDGTSLHLVAHFGTIQMACLLLARNSTPEFLNHRDKELRTAAMCSMLGDKCDILKLFIQVGADITLKGTDGMTCLHFATRSGSLQATKILLDSYSSSVSLGQFNSFINAKDDGGWTAMVWAVEHNHTAIVSLLLNYGADTSICDMENNTALHWAVISTCDDVVKILLQANARCNVQNVNGDTPLHIACRQSNTCAALMLITRGADLMIKNKDGQIPYDCIRDEEDPCARAVGFNMQMRSIGPTGLHVKVIFSDISNGRESYPIEVVRRPKSNKISAGDLDDETIIPDFKYITKSILLQNSVQIDYRVSQMRICSCNDSCNTDKCQCSTISVQNWYTTAGRLNGDFNFDDPPMIFECNDVCGCNKLLCKNRVVQNGIKIPLQVFECSQRTKGWGARTLRAIPRGSFVAEYTGEILTDMEADRRTDDSYFFDLGSSDHCIDANYYGNISRFFNHSCTPNIVPVRVYYDHQDYRFPKIAFFSCRDISVGEELAFDYGEKFWAVKQKYFTCKCESVNCRFAVNPERNQLANGEDQSALVADGSSS